MTQNDPKTGAGGAKDETAHPPRNPSAPKDPAKGTGGRPADVAEVGGPKGLEPTRYGDWEKGGRCTDF